MNREVKTERLSQLVNEAKDKILKTDFSQLSNLIEALITLLIDIFSDPSVS